MDVTKAILERRSVKRFADQPVARDKIEMLLRAAVQAPNHRMTQPWRFYVLGPDARRAYGAALGTRKARKVSDPDAAALVQEKVANEHAAVPAMIAVACVQDEDPDVRQEDYAAAMMGVQNLLLAATALGVASVPLGGFFDRQVNDLLEVDGLHEAALYVLPVGHAGKP